MLANSESGYGLVSVLLHWLSALLTILLFGVGLYMVGLSYYDPLYHELPEWHKSVGVVLALLSLFRVVWRVLSGPPAPLAEKRWQGAAARLVHATMLALLILLPVTGYFIVTAEGKPLMVFELTLLPALLELTPNQTDLVGRWHLWGAWALIGLAALHAAAALKHHFIDADRTLIRMLTIKGQ
ncbi:MAG: cytochrome b [Pseudomonadota bacterium]|nr:cytochrome b [Pseudomonadota bacterium]